MRKNNDLVQEVIMTVIFFTMGLIAKKSSKTMGSEAVRASCSESAYKFRSRIRPNFRLEEKNLLVDSATCPGADF
jgi:hypothetical protein